MRLCSFPRAARVFACAALLASSAAAPAAAEVPSPTAQARAAHAEFLAYADPPPEPGAVCLVDTGVDPNPDTTGVVLRTAIDGGSGWDEGKTKHGTKMAMVMGGAVNGWGTVGAWPALRIVSVRALPVGMESFPFQQYERGVLRCQEMATAHNIKVVELALGGSRSPSAEDRDMLFDRVDAGRIDGLNVVAAAGNDAGPVQAPASGSGVLGVGGADPVGALCSFSSRGDGLDLAAPGCGVEQADPLTGVPVLAGGTSQASAFTAAVLAALRSYRPELGPADAEALLVRTAASGSLLDVEAAFRAAGLGEVVEQGRARVPRQVPPAESTAPGTAVPRAQPSTPTFSPTRVPRPRLRALRRHSRGVSVRVANRPRSATLVVTACAGRGEFRGRCTRARRTSDAVTVRAGRGALLRVHFVQGGRTSAPLVIRRVR